MEIFEAIDYLVIGHVVRDISGNSFQPGGTVTFAAITASKLGYKVGVVTSTSDLKLLEVFKKYNMHLNDEANWRHPDYPGVVIMGHMGWYTHPNPNTNDSKFLPWDCNGCPPHHYLLHEDSCHL